MPRRREARVALPRQRVTSVVKICRSHTLDTGQRDGRAQQPRPLHADADHAEPHTLAGRDGFRGLRKGHGLEQDAFGCAQHPGRDGAGLQKSSTGKIAIHRIDLL